MDRKMAGCIKAAVPLIAVVFATMAPLASQDLDFLAVELIPEMDIPLGETGELWNLGGGIEAQVRLVLPAEWGFFSGFQFYLDGAWRSLGTDALTTLSLVSGGLGLAYDLYFSPRFGLGLGGNAGVYLGDYDGLQSAGWYLSAGGNVKFRLSPGVSLSAGANYLYYDSQDQELMSGLNVQLMLRFNLGGFQERSRVKLEDPKLKTVFPVLYSQYDRNSLGSVTLVNQEEAPIQEVTVSFMMPQYMNQPKICITLPELARGQKAEVPLYALFNSEMLKLVESTKVQAQVIVDYKLLGAERSISFDQTLRLEHRNAMTWDDDAKASAFVSSKDPAVLRYSRHVAGIIRTSGMEGLPGNVRYAIGLFETLKLMDINYVVDPTTPYADLSANQESVDFLQYPFETLNYHGGDCDDLSILFSSILQSAGISTAFLTIPGHIYMAFDSGLDPVQAASFFPDINDLIITADRVWIPLEVTLLKDTFVKAWTYGAQEWREAAGSRALYPMDASWVKYDPVSPPGTDGRIPLPTSDRVAKAYQGGMDRFVAIALPAKVETMKQLLEGDPNNSRILNRIGILYARFGQYDEARAYFNRALKAGLDLAQTNIGNLEYLRRNFPAAKTAFSRSLRANPVDPAAVLGLALTAYETGNYEEAAGFWVKLQDIDPTLAEQNSFLRSRVEDTSTQPGAEEDQK